MTIRNTATVAVTYNFDSFDGGTTYVISNTTGAVDLFPPRIDKQKAVTVTLTPPTLQLGPGQTGTLRVDFTPATMDTTLVPVYSGFITVQSSATIDGTLQIPYAGVAFNMTTLPIFDTGFPAFTRASATSSDDIISTDGAVFTMDVEKSDLPAFAVRLFMGTRVLRMDLLPASPSEITGTTLIAGLRIIRYYTPKSYC